LKFVKDAVMRIDEKHAFVEGERWRRHALSVSTGYDEEAKNEISRDGKCTADGAAT